MKRNVLLTPTVLTTSTCIRAGRSDGGDAALLDESQDTEILYSNISNVIIVSN